MPDIVPASSESILSPGQQAKVAAMERATAVLNEAGVSYVMFASPDAPATTMKWMLGTRMSYATDTGDIIRETGAVRASVLPAVLKALTRGMKGLIAVADKDGVPLSVFSDGESRRVEPTAPKIII